LASDVVEERLLRKLAEVDTPTVSNAIETLGVRGRWEGFMNREVRCMFPEMGVRVGYAVTVAFSEHREDVKGPSMGEVWAAVASARGRPKVLVAQDVSSPEYFCLGCWFGEVYSWTLRGLGVVCVVTDGGVRDLDRIPEIGVQYFAGGVTASHGRIMPRAVNVPVTVAGLTVKPGDLLHTDRHGVVLVPKDRVPEVLEAVQGVLRREGTLIERLRAPDVTPEKVVQILRGG